DMAGRNSPEDSRLKSLETLARYNAVDTRQADNVAASARAMFEQAKQDWNLDEERGRYLEWAAWMHEIGQSISHSQFHRHGAYLLEYSDLAGFSRPEQRLLSFLVRAHRRKFPLKEWQALPESEQRDSQRLARLLRLAVILNHSRPEQAPAAPRLEVDDDTLHLHYEGGDEPGLLCTDLEREADYLASTDFALVLHAVTADR
ncbi:MAG: exopolyphosphatase, partial [Pseudomonadota bacterium]|nr:exopolyphosphatase [Pseudomonadota bacterium]